MSPDELIGASLDAGLEVIAVTDHDELTAITDVVEASEDTPIHVVPGVEISTDAGHILCYAPTANGFEVLTSLLDRCGARPDHTVQLEELLRIVSDDGPRDGRPYRRSVILAAAHVHKPGSLLGSSEVGTFASRLGRVRQMHAVEVNDADVRDTWLTQGVGSSGTQLPILTSSDAHTAESIGAQHTWIWLPDLSMSSFLQALATFGNSLDYRDERPSSPRHVIRSLHISEGLHADLDVRFDARVNAFIGPPSIGKSLIIDALRFLFRDECEIPEVHELTERRVQRHLPQGTVVSAIVESDGVVHELFREVGGSALPELPFKPIIFSQTELIRRAMEKTPSVSLIDIHIDAIDELYDGYASALEDVKARLHSALQLAAEIRDLSRVLENEVDGLAAVNRQLASLGVAEELARRSQSIEAVLSWRANVATKVEELAVPAVEFGPLPPEPELPDDDKAELEDALPRAALMERFRKLEEDLSTLVESFRADAIALLGDDEDLRDARDEAEAKLTEAVGEDAEDVLQKLRHLRQRKVELEEKKRLRSEKRDDLNDEINQLHEAVVDADEQSIVIDEARRDACRRINDSLSAFFCKVEQNDVSELVEALRSLRTGLHGSTLEAYCSELDVSDLAESAIRHIASETAVDDDRLDSQDPHERITGHLLLNEDWNCLEILLTARVEERLEIGYLQVEGDPQPFHELTEGLRALAIKEVSFVASDRPVISDQPEDSVPTRSVYDELVPTFQRQRQDRQFILVSHDANIVVGGDADRVLVLSADDVMSGNLFELEVSRGALDHLEGGEEAFARRQERYAALAPPS